MKHNFKKIISLVLTAVMILGTMSALVPFMASAEEVTYPYTLKKNETAVAPNGVTYRFDVADGHTNSWAKLNADGSWELNISNGDMLWFPDVEMTDSSEIYAEVTSLSTLNHFAGLAYGVVSSTDSAYTGTNVAVIRTNSGKVRLRATGATRDALNNDKGGVTVNNFEVAINDAWTSIANPSNGNWNTDKTIYHKIYQTADKVVTEFGAPGKGAFGNPESQTSYAKGMDGMYAFDGGSVGYTMVWAEGKNYGFRIDALTITNCEVAGEAKDSYSPIVTDNGGSEDDAVEVVKSTITGNTNVEINDIIVRMDYPTPSHSPTTLTLCSDGSIIMRGNRGDLFWLPNVEVTENSVLTTTVTMDSATDHLKASAGTIFNIDANGAWDNAADTAIIAALRPYNGNSRRSLGAISYQSATTSADYTKILSDVNYTPTNANFGNTWALGASVTTTISKTADGTVKAVFTDGNGDLIVDASYNNDQYPFEGAVGYMTHWSNSADYYQYTISEFTITNALVNGELVEEFDLVAEIAEYMNPTKGVTDEAISLSLDGTIGLNFAFNADAGVPAGATVVATMNGKVVAEQAVVSGANVVTAPVNAKEMNDDVNFAIMLDGEVYDNHSYTVSVAEYAAELKKNAEWTALMDAMLNYGAAAQKLLNYKADGVVVADSSFDMSAIQDITFNGNKALLDGLYMNLSLESDTVMNLYFKPAEGVTLNVTVNGEAVELVDNGDGYYVATIKGIAADELADGALIVVNGDLSFTCSALNWAKIASADANADVANVAKALAVYANEAASKN